VLGDEMDVRQEIVAIAAPGPIHMDVSGHVSDPGGLPKRAVGLPGGAALSYDCV
jgi:hypothetical protein